ncbi:MAG: alanine racemase [Elusimicrobiota bacterium]|jgi:alanine racemase|nr:alanine racemase [Elusimicrobiota bacterium]
MKTGKNIPVLRPTCAAVDLAALKFNLNRAAQIARQRAANPKIMLMVKANAYGHGDILISSCAQENNLCAAFGAASIEEGINLRQNGIKLPILVLGSIYPFEYFKYALENDLSVTIGSLRAANYIKDLAAELKTTALCHVKHETGMNRIGSRKPAALEILKTLNNAPYIKIEGVYSHFARADTDSDYTNMQAAYFKEFLSEASAQNLQTGLAHISASCAFLKYPALGFDMVRLGRLAYGLEDSFKPVLSLKSKVVFIKDARENTSIGYGRGFITARPSKIATIPIGYGDGYSRALSNKARVLINGRRVPIIGNIAMDMMTADITDLGDIPVGSEVVLIGRQESEEITAKELADLAGTIDYEILTSITSRVPRIAA